MKRSKLFIATLFLTFIFIASFAQNKTDAVIIGHVVSKGEHIPFVNIYLEDNNNGTVTDVTGHYMMVDVPEGDFILVASMIGFKTQKKEVKLEAGKTIEVNFELEEDILKVGEVVVTGTKTFKRQTECRIVNVLTPND